jgi:hypothetical protein
MEDVELTDRSLSEMEVSPMAMLAIHSSAVRADAAVVASSHAMDPPLTSEHVGSTSVIRADASEDTQMVDASTPIGVASTSAILQAAAAASAFFEARAYDSDIDTDITSVDASILKAVTFERPTAASLRLAVGPQNDRQALVNEAVNFFGPPLDHSHFSLGTSALAKTLLGPRASRNSTIAGIAPVLDSLMDQALTHVPSFDPTAASFDWHAYMSALHMAAYSPCLATILASRETKGKDRARAVSDSVVHSLIDALSKSRHAHRPLSDVDVDPGVDPASVANSLHLLPEPLVEGT